MKTCEKRVSEWANRTLHEGLVILDTETTGLDSSAEIIQIALVNMDGECLFSSYVRPTTPIDEDDEAFFINNISQAMVENAPAFPAIHPELVKHLSGKTVLAYNADFDRRMLEQDCQRHKLPIPSVCRWSCLLNAFSAYRDEYTRGGKLKRHSLTNACAYMGIPAPDHTATGDASAILSLLKSLVRGEE